MWIRFTEQSRHIVFLAQEEAFRLGEKYVDTEHLLFGLTCETESMAAQVLTALNISLEQVRHELRQQMSSSDPVRQKEEMQLSQQGKRVIDLSYEEAKQLKKNYLGTEHLLLGVVRESEGLGGRILHSLNVDLEQARKQLRILYDKQSVQ